MSYTINPLTPEPKAAHNPDMITIAGVIYENVLQYDHEGKSVGESPVQVSHSINRTPKLPNKSAPQEKRFKESEFPNVPGFKWCSAADHWVELKGFSPDSHSCRG